MIAVADVQTSPDPELWTLQEQWPDWTVWRSRVGDQPHGWCATRRGQGRELSRTFMEPTAELLEKALVEQKDQALIYG